LIPYAEVPLNEYLRIVGEDGKKGDGKKGDGNVRVDVTYLGSMG
jgi:hypothetical protein